MLPKEKRINEELARISKLFESIDGNQREAVNPLLQNAAFMKVTLEDLQTQINKDGPTDEYKNGANQHGIKQSATLQAYNSLVKNYASVIKNLAQLLPPEQKKTVDRLQQFLTPQRPKTREEEWIDKQLEETREELHHKWINKELERGTEILKKQRE